MSTHCKLTPIADEIDPAPRILRIIAAVISPTGRGRRPSKIVNRLRRAAEILEGDKMRMDETRTSMGRTLHAERRVLVSRGRRKKTKAKNVKSNDPSRAGRIEPRAGVSDEDLRMYEEAVARGEIERAT